jgi:hypothetical protein
MDPTFPYAGKLRIPIKEFQLRTRIENSTKDWVNAKQFEHWQTDVPNLTNNIPKTIHVPDSINVRKGYVKPLRVKDIPYMDMSPINTRGDARDYKQSQPYVAGGPDLAYNPYFDRYDPVSDPRNAVRELRSAVYEDKLGLRGEEESRKILRRQYENRWVGEELIDEDLMDTYLRYEIAISGKKD